MIVFFFNTLKCNFILWRNAEFSAVISPVFSVTWSFRIIQICWFCAHENISFLLLAMMKTVKLPNIFVEMDFFFFFFDE